MLSDKDLDLYVKRVKGAKMDIKTQLEAMKTTHGQVRECYKVILHEKISKLAQLVGEHWRESCSDLTRFETPELLESVLEGCLPEEKK